MKKIVVVGGLATIVGFALWRRLDAMMGALAKATGAVARAERVATQAQAEADKLGEQIKIARGVAELAAAERDFAEARLARALLAAISISPENYRATGSLLGAVPVRGIVGVQEAMRAARAAGTPVTVPWAVRQAFPELDETRVRRAARSDADETGRAG